MSTRGVQFEHDPGDVVLCFEPDITKARVLYDAKIIDQNVTRDGKGRKKGEYHIHFQGWNSSWDRTVPASFVLKSSEKNRQLMKKIGNIARHVRNNRRRKRKIDQLLKVHFGKLPKFDSSDSSESESASDLDDDEDDETFDEEEEVEETSTKRKNIKDGNREEENGLSRMDDTESETADTHDSGEEQVGPARPPKIDIPENLMKKLEDDCFLIQRKKKLVKLPAEPNVLTVLEAYVKNFALNLIYGTVEKRPYPARETYVIAPERSVDLCKEVMDGLRVFFDFSLNSVLLYDVEQSQYNKIIATFKPDSLNRDVIDAQSPLVNSPRLRSHGKSSRPGSPARAEASPKIPRLSPKAIKKEIMTDDDIQADEDEEEEAMSCRRMTRHAYQTELQKEKIAPPKLKQAAGSSSKKCCDPATSSGRRSHAIQEEKQKTDTKRRDSLRSSIRHTSMSSQDAEKEEVVVEKKSGMFDRITPPPPLLIPNAISSKAGSSHSSRSPCSTPTQLSNSGANREAALNRILEWKLIPDEVYHQSPPPASVVYGAQHLLRIFVKLPEYLGQMAIPTVKLKSLIKHLEMFLEYLSDRSEELYQESCYIDASESISPTKQLKR